MSIFSSIASAAHTFVAWFEKQITAIENNAPTIEQHIESGVNYAVGVLKIVYSQVDSNSQAAGIIKVAIQDLLTLSAVTYDAGAHPSLASGFQAIVNNLTGLEQAAGIKNANSIATVAKVINTIAAIASVLVPAVA